MPEPFEEFRYSGGGAGSHGQLSYVCGYRCHLTLNCSSALHLELSVSFLLELRLVTLKIWFRTSLVKFFGPCKNRRTAPFCPVPGLS